jgi:hypothetical protein
VHDLRYEFIILLRMLGDSIFALLKASDICCLALSVKFVLGGVLSGGLLLFVACLL